MICTYDDDDDDNRYMLAYTLIQGRTILLCQKGKRRLAKLAFFGDLSKHFLPNIKQK